MKANECPPMPWRLNYRRALGRPVSGTTSYIRSDTGKMVTQHTALVDPILLLRGARRFANSPGWHAQEYGRIRQAVVSPVYLPREGV